MSPGSPLDIVDLRVMLLVFSFDLPVFADATIFGKRLTRTGGEERDCLAVRADHWLLSPLCLPKAR